MIEASLEYGCYDAKGGYLGGCRAITKERIMEVCREKEDRMWKVEINGTTVFDAQTMHNKVLIETVSKFLENCSDDDMSESEKEFANLMSRYLS